MNKEKEPAKQEGLEGGAATEEQELTPEKPQVKAEQAKGDLLKGQERPKFSWEFFRQDKKETEKAMEFFDKRAKDYLQFDRDVYEEKINGGEITKGEAKEERINSLEKELKALRQKLDNAFEEEKIIRETGSFHPEDDDSQRALRRPRGEEGIPIENYIRQCEFGVLMAEHVLFLTKTEE